MTRAIVLLALVLALPVAAQAHDFVEGTHYQRIAESRVHEPGTPIEVVEVFWYGCPACYQFTPSMHRWLQTRPVDVEFSRIGADFGPQWRVHARAYATAESLGVVDHVHQALFNAIHVSRNPLADAAAVGRIFETHAGVSAAEFQRAWDSFGVATRLRRGDQFVRRARVNATPTVIVAGTWSFTPVSAGSYDEAIELLDVIIERVRGAPSVAIEPEATASDAPQTSSPGPASASPPTAERTPATVEQPERAPVVPLWLVIVGVVVAVTALGVVSLRGKR